MNVFNKYAAKDFAHIIDPRDNLENGLNRWHTLDRIYIYEFNVFR